MNIEITHEATGSGDGYRISINGFLLYAASLEAHNYFDNELVLYRLHPEKAPRLLLSRNLSFFSASYDLCRWSEQQHGWQQPQAFFRTRSVWKSHYHCQQQQCGYDIYTHSERLRSLYKDDEMIGYWEKELVTVSDTECYKITADDDCDVELMIGLCLILDTFSRANKQGLVHLDLGSLGSEAKAFDRDWKPKYAPLDHLWTTSL